MSRKYDVSKFKIDLITCDDFSSDRPYIKVTYGQLEYFVWANETTGQADDLINEAIDCWEGVSYEEERVC